MMAHEDEEWHRGERLFLHEPDGLEDHQIENRVAEADQSEDDRQDDEGEGDRESHEDPGEQRAQQDQAEDFGAHSVRPVVAAYALSRNSEIPWTKRNASEIGITNLNGQSGGRQGLASETSRMWKEWSASSDPIQKKRAMPGKKNKRYNRASAIPFARVDQY
jgi:hypothetical protein